MASAEGAPGEQAPAEEPGPRAAAEAAPPPAPVRKRQFARSGEYAEWDYLKGAGAWAPQVRPPPLPSLPFQPNGMPHLAAPGPPPRRAAAGAAGGAPHTLLDPGLTRRHFVRSFLPPRPSLAPH